jgi:hypothetical protein
LHSEGEYRNLAYEGYFSPINFIDSGDDMVLKIASTKIELHGIEF